MKLFQSIIIAVAATVCSHAQIDTLSYALGHQTTLGLLAGNNPLMTDMADAVNYIRGLKESLPSTTAPKDSTFLVNYSIGGMEGIFLSDGFVHKKKEERPRVDCIIQGLRLVADGKLTLPRDTIDAMAIIDSYPDSLNPTQLPEEEKCRFFTAYGIMKGLQPGLQAYIDALGKTEIKANQQYFALGMADALSFMTEPESAYEMGKMVGHSFLMNYTLYDNVMSNVDPSGFLEGARAALGLAETTIDRDELENYLDNFYGKQFEEPEYPSDKSDPKGLTLDANEPRPVDWMFKAKIAATQLEIDQTDCNPMPAILNRLSVQGIEYSEIAEGYFLYSMNGNDKKLELATIGTLDNAMNEQNLLPQGFELFCDRDMDGSIIFGMVKDSPTFSSLVKEATLCEAAYTDQATQLHQIQFRMGTDITREQKRQEWATFTAENINRIAVCTINGTVVMCPKINAEITSGNCAFTTTDVSSALELLNSKKLF